jgi:hypothetical protein
MAISGRFTARRVVTPDLVAIEDAPPTAMEGVAWTVFPEAPSEPLQPAATAPSQARGGAA